MSAFVARNTFRAVQRRQFSLLNTMRHMARSFEPHPFQRMSNVEAAKPDYTKLFGSRLATIGTFVPFAAAVLGWPYGAMLVADGHM